MTRAPFAELFSSAVIRSAFLIVISSHIFTFIPVPLHIPGMRFYEEKGHNVVHSMCKMLTFSIGASSSGGGNSGACRKLNLLVGSESFGVAKIGGTGSAI
jgi:hypothetical protein